MSEAVLNPNKVSRAGVILIKSFEGFRPVAVRRTDGVWVIGYGHTASAREGATVSESDAELLLQYDLIPVVRAIRETVKVPLNAHQFDALASFAFSVGVERFRVSDVLVLVNAGKPQEAAAAMVGWHDEAEAHLPPRRRTAERALFTAAPDAPVALADLLSQSLAPFPAVAPTQEAGPPEAAEVAPFPSQDNADLGAAAPQAVANDTSEAQTAVPSSDTRVVWAPEDGASPSEGAASETPETPVDSPPDTPRVRVDPGSPWPFFILGALGMVALGAAGAAFRRAAHPGGGDTGLIGVALGVIAVACIVVAGWNMYQRWGRPGR